ncbi:DOPA 4,5-dioxygenase family protein [Oceanimonas marisflavi]|uniref:DOPA 4,5-dioxygenase family protein n=1 Tax=Oceanimonas marisflavi TaxID=2059724 RepID=UPI001E2A8A70|nr:DOPA 4,5-dioxygenase family protein [Oceanimonas marisflavi]
MTSPKHPINNHNTYHAHIYFDAHTLAFATSLCQRIAEKFSLAVGAFIRNRWGHIPCGVVR